MADGVIPYKQCLLDLCNKRGDDLDEIVWDRILGAPSDLHAADARYHWKCNAYFHSATHRSQGMLTMKHSLRPFKSLAMIGQNMEFHRYWRSLFRQRGVHKVTTCLTWEFSPAFCWHDSIAFSRDGNLIGVHVTSNRRLIVDDKNDAVNECIGKEIRKEIKTEKRDLKFYSQHIYITGRRMCLWTFVGSAFRYKSMSVWLPAFHYGG